MIDKNSKFLITILYESGIPSTEIYSSLKYWEIGSLTLQEINDYIKQNSLTYDKEKTYNPDVEFLHNAYIQSQLTESEYTHLLLTIIEPYLFYTIHGGLLYKDLDLTPDIVRYFLLHIAPFSNPIKQGDHD